ncbi:MAG: DUF1905 domain-containing protein [Bacteroidetes bacterium]|nr:DUF1905 domain-containing protein [Bacteroidota bacterium]
MIKYTTTIFKFEKKGEKTGWTYIDVPADVARKLKPGNKRSFRVKGKLDNFSIKGIALLPMGEGDFIMPLNAMLRKGIGKKHGAMLHVQLQEDKTPLKLNAGLMECLADDPDALRFFKSLAASHQNYFSKWIESAKTDVTKTKRIAQTVTAMCRKQGFPEMMRSLKNNRM